MTQRRGCCRFRERGGLFKTIAAVRQSPQFCSLALRLRSASRAPLQPRPCRQLPRAHFIRICSNFCAFTRLARPQDVELFSSTAIRDHRSCTDAIFGDANGKADSICRPLHPSNRRTPMTSVRNVSEMQDALKDALKTHWKLFLFQGIVMLILRILAVAWPVWA